MKALWISDLRGWESYVSQQIYYSLQARDAENELIPIAIEEGLGVLVWSPLAGGLLSGKYRRGQDAPEGSRRFEGWTEPPVNDEDRLYDTVDVLVEIGEGHGVSAAQVALAYTLAKPAVTSVIVGARTEEQLRDNLAAAELSCRRRRSTSWTQSARCRCSIRTGIRPTPSPPASARLISACSADTCHRERSAMSFGQTAGAYGAAVCT